MPNFLCKSFDKAYTLPFLASWLYFKWKFYDLFLLIFTAIVYNRLPVLILYGTLLISPFHCIRVWKYRPTRTRLNRQFGIIFKSVHTCHLQQQVLSFSTSVKAFVERVVLSS